MPNLIEQAQVGAKRPNYSGRTVSVPDRPVNSTVALNSTTRRGVTLATTGATTLNVANTTIKADDIVIFSLNTVGGTPAGHPYLFTLTPGTGFGVRTAAGDTSTYNYLIL